MKIENTHWAEVTAANGESYVGPVLVKFRRVRVREYFVDDDILRVRTVDCYMPAVVKYMTEDEWLRSYQGMRRQVFLARLRSGRFKALPPGYVMENYIYRRPFATTGAIERDVQRWRCGERGMEEPPLQPTEREVIISAWNDYRSTNDNFVPENFVAEERP